MHFGGEAQEASSVSEFSMCSSEELEDGRATPERLCRKITHDIARIAPLRDHLNLDAFRIQREELNQVQ
jgi:hypothetical protein